MSMKIHNSTIQPQANIQQVDVAQINDVSSSAVSAPSVDLQQMVADLDISIKQAVKRLLEGNTLFRALSENQQRNLVGHIETQLTTSPFANSLINQIKAA